MSTQRAEEYLARIGVSPQAYPDLQALRELQLRICTRCLSRT